MNANTIRSKYKILLNSDRNKTGYKILTGKVGHM